MDQNLAIQATDFSIAQSILALLFPATPAWPSAPD